MIILLKLRLKITSEKKNKSYWSWKNNKGINLSFDIEFYPNSFQILQKEYKKIDLIAKLLEKFKKITY